MDSQSTWRKRLIGQFLRLARGTAFILLLILIAIPGWILLSRGDLADAGDDDLLTHAVDRRSGGPAHRTLALLGSEFADFDHSRIQKALLAFREGDFSDAAWVQDQADQFADLRKLVVGNMLALARTQDTEIDLSDEITVVEGGMGFQSLARISSARGLMFSRDHRVDDALEDALFGLRAGHVFSIHQDIDLLGLMVAGVTQSISLATLEQVVRENSITPKMSRRITDEIAQCRPTRASWQQMWANEYRWIRGVALTAFAPGTNPEAVVDPAEDAWASFLVRLVPDDYMIQPNRTLARMSSLYRTRRDQTGRNCLSIYSRQSDEVTTMDKLSLLVRPNPVGEILVMLAHPRYERFELKRCGFEKNIALAQVVVASKAYSDREGHLPESLDALIPRYLAAVPTNPYDGGALGYSETAGTISVDTSGLATTLGPDRASVLDGQSMARMLDRRVDGGAGD